MAIVQSQKFMRTNCHEGFCADDDLLNSPILAWNGFLSVCHGHCLGEIHFIHLIEEILPQFHQLFVPLWIHMFCLEASFYIKDPYSAGFLPSIGLVV